MDRIRPLETLRTAPIQPAKKLATLRHGWRMHTLSPHTNNPNDLVDVRAIGIAGANHYYQEQGAPYHKRIPGSIPNLLVRKEVAALLSIANKYLRAHDMELFVFDGWRPQAVQYYRRNVWFPAHLLRMHPRWHLVQIENEIERFWAHAVETEEEIDVSCPPPHATGAAVDLTLRTNDGHFLPMGTGFDDFTRASSIDAFEYPNMHHAEHIERDNRRILVGVMHDLGFLGHPNEWWHYSYGDQAWAIAESRAKGIKVSAHFGAINPLPYLAE